MMAERTLILVTDYDLFKAGEKDREEYIRLFSLAALPFWLFYNLRCGAYGAALGNVLVVGSILSAMYRYDSKKIQQK